MQKLYIAQTPISPEINFSPSERIFIIRGNSAPEDVRAMYYPLIEWVRLFVDKVIEGEFKQFTGEDPVDFHIDLSYFNSSSAKFLYDIILELRRLRDAGKPVTVKWFHDEEDLDMLEAGTDISQLAGMEFSFIAKPASER